MPLRRCVGCGRVAPKSELLRIALAGEPGAERRIAVLDHSGAMPGRGAYLCRDASTPAHAGVERACLGLATRRRAIPRALRAAATLAPELLESGSG